MSWSFPERAYTLTSEMLKLSFKVSCCFFHWKISLCLNLSFVSAYADRFVKLDCNSSLLPQTDEGTVTNVNEVPIRALILFSFLGVRKGSDRGWRYTGGKPISFRWFKTETNKRGAVCVATCRESVVCTAIIQTVVTLV